MRLKRLFDIVFAVAGLILLSPFLLLITLLVKRDSEGPVFYRGVRTGYRGGPFRIFKFRTMVADAEKRGGFSTARNDPRITRVGRLLRKYKLDELPQLLSVLKGDMSIVGPRPEMPEYTKLYEGEEKLILTVRPGITDYASLEYIQLGEVLGDDEVDRNYEEKIRPLKNALRVKYVKERSFFADMKIIFKTFWKLLRA